MNRSGRRSRFRTLALAFAALLHLFAVPGEVVLHGWLHADPHAPGWSAERHVPGTAHHHDLDCFICQAAHNRALPEPGAAPAAAERSSDVPRALAVSLLVRLARTQVQARAPPVSIA